MNSNKSTIIFVTPYRYMGIPQYNAILQYLKDRNINALFLDYNYPDDVKLNLKVMKQNFHEIYQLQIISTRGSFSITNKDIINNIRNIRVLKSQIQNFLDEKKPIAVISTSDISDNDRIVSSWCKKRKIPFIIVQPTIIEGMKKLYKRPSLKHIIQYLFFNVFLSAPLFSRQKLYGNEAKEGYLILWSKYLILDKNRRNVHVIGNPAFDKFFKEFSPEKVLKNRVVICTELIEVFGKDIHSEIMKIYVDGIKSHPNIEFIIKVHPKESEKEYIKTFNQDEFPNVKVVKDANLHKLFEECDIQVSVNSTASFEAAAMGVPVITVTPDSIYRKITDLFKGEINIRVRNSTEFISAIKKAKSKNHRKEFFQKRKEYFEKIMLSTDGESGKRAANTILNIIKNHNKK